MPATAIKNLSISNVDGLMAFLDSSFLAAGWTSFAVMNSTTGAPPNYPTSGFIGQERIYKISGTTTSPTSAYIGMYRVTANYTGIGSGRVSVGFYGFTGCKGPVSINSITYPGTGLIATVTTSAAHGFASGDLVCINGNSNSYFQTGCTGSSTPTIGQITVTGPTTFTYYDVTLNTVGAISGTGGTALVVYNMAGVRFSQVTGVQSYWSGTDAPMQVIGEIDEFRCAFVIKQSGNTQYCQVGQVGRRHIPAAFSDTAFTTNSITGPGSVTISLNRPLSNICSSQYACLIDTVSGLCERFSITVVNSTTVTATLTKTGTYQAGALFGDDPVPLFIACNGSTTVALNSIIFYGAFFNDLSRTDGHSNMGYSQTYLPIADTSILSSNLGADVSGYNQGRPIVLTRTFAPIGTRANIAGTAVDMVVAFGSNGQNDDDFQQTGCGAGSDYAVFPSLTCNGMYVSFGPGQS